MSLPDVTPEWLYLKRGKAPLILSMPHTGTLLPLDLANRLSSPWLARRDADWWIELLYGEIAERLDATVVRTAISRSVIDVNRDPSGASLYPGQNGTDLCPVTTFDGEPLYLAGAEPDAAEIKGRLETYYRPYHLTVQAEIQRLRSKHRNVVVYDCHSIRSVIPHLFEGTLPVMNIGTFDGRSCDAGLERLVYETCSATAFSVALNQRFKGGWITRSLGNPDLGVHAVQMELACRGYLDEPSSIDSLNWPPAYDDYVARPLQETLAALLAGMRGWVTSANQSQQ